MKEVVVLESGFETEKQFLKQETENIGFLASLVDSPEAFLLAQNELLYNRDLSTYHILDLCDENGLPVNTNRFYFHKNDTDNENQQKLIPRVLNIGMGPEENRKLPAVNIDLSSLGKPDVVAGAQELPFADNSFTIVRASHVLEHINQEDIVSVLSEWRRVLHPNGLLYIAVPDAEVVFSEILEGKTPKNRPALDLVNTTAPLSQIYGLGYENPDTDLRWKHKIIFSFSLLKHFLESSGFSSIKRLHKEDDLAFLSGIDDDSQNHYSLLVSAGFQKQPQASSCPLTERAFREKCAQYNISPSVNPAASFIIPVFNEEKNLRNFLAFLENSHNLTKTDREFIFVVNGCEDNSEGIIQEYIKDSYLRTTLTHSEKGIIPAFKKGVEARKLDGFIGKLDADTILHPHTLDLLQVHLAENNMLQVTYAEPTPLDPKNAYNEVEHNPIMRSQRLYYHGRTSLYRKNPFTLPSNKDIPTDLKAEDIFLSFFYSYYEGLSSMNQTPNAVVYGKTVKSFKDLVQQISRSESEMKRVFNAYPHFRVLAKLLEREIYPGDYLKIADRAKSKLKYTNDWAQIGNTK